MKLLSIALSIMLTITVAPGMMAGCSMGSSPDSPGMNGSKQPVKDVASVSASENASAEASAESSAESSAEPSAESSAEAPSKAEYRKITPQEAKTMMDAGGVIILDVRTQEEFDGGHIKDAVLLPDTDVAQKAETVLPDRNARILVYCRSGRRSGLAAHALVDLGYTEVYDFGGIIDWPYDTVK